MLVTQLTDQSGQRDLARRAEGLERGAALDQYAELAGRTDGGGRSGISGSYSGMAISCTPNWWRRSSLSCRAAVRSVSGLASAATSVCTDVI